MASSGKDRIQSLLELGEADRSDAWPDYLHYGFTEADIPALLDLVADQTFDQMESDSTEVWAPLHAWRTLGQLGSSQAIVPLLDQFDRLCEDDWALPELSTVMGMLGEPAIEPLSDFLNDRRHMEFARVMALDGLAEIASGPSTCYRDGLYWRLLIASIIVIFQTRPHGTLTGYCCAHLDSKCG